MKTKNDALKLIQENPNMSTRELAEIGGFLDDEFLMRRFKGFIQILEEKGMIERDGKYFCHAANKPVLHWKPVING